MNLICSTCLVVRWHSDSTQALDIGLTHLVARRFEEALQ